jgi:hypothetical protein
MFLLGKSASKHAPINLGSRLPSPCLSNLHTELLVSSHPMIGKVVTASYTATLEEQKGRIEGGGDIFCSIQIFASIYHGSRCHPTDAMRPYSQRRSMQLGAVLIKTK